MQVMDMPAWVWRFSKRLGLLQRGRAYSVTFVIPTDGSDPIWTVLDLGKLEESQAKNRSETRHKVLE